MVAEKIAPTRRMSRGFLIVALILSVGLVNTSCERSDSVESEYHRGTRKLPNPWYKLGHPYDEVPKLNPGRPIFITFVADWDAAGAVHRRIFFTEKVSKTLQDRGWLCLLGDMTKMDPFVERELQRLGRNSIPTHVIYDHKKEQWIFLNEYLTEESFLAEVLKIESGEVVFRGAAARTTGFNGR